MGVEASIFQVSLSQLVQIKCDSSLTLRWFFPDDQLDSEYNDKNSFYLGRSFHGLHFMLCGSYEPKPDDPLKDFFVFGKHKLGFEKELGLDCAYLLPRELNDMLRILRNVKRIRLSAKFSPDEMNRIRIYPGRWCFSDFDVLYDLYLKLRHFYKDAAARDHAVINIVY